MSNLDVNKETQGLLFMVSFAPEVPRWLKEWSVEDVGWASGKERQETTWELGFTESTTSERAGFCKDVA